MKLLFYLIRFQKFILDLTQNQFTALPINPKNGFKRKLENEFESETENSPSKRKRHTVDFRLKVISELKTST